MIESLSIYPSSSASSFSPVSQVVVLLPWAEYLLTSKAIVKGDLTSIKAFELLHAPNKLFLKNCYQLSLICSKAICVSNLSVDGPVEYGGPTISFCLSELLPYILTTSLNLSCTLWVMMDHITYSTRSALQVLQVSLCSLETLGKPKEFLKGKKCMHRALPQCAKEIQWES